MMLYCRKPRVYLVVLLPASTSKAQAEMVICCPALSWVLIAVGPCLIVVSWCTTILHQDTAHRLLIPPNLFLLLPEPPFIKREHTAILSFLGVEAEPGTSFRYCSGWWMGETMWRAVDNCPQLWPRLRIMPLCDRGSFSPWQFSSSTFQFKPTLTRPRERNGFLNLVSLRSASLLLISYPKVVDNGKFCSISENLIPYQRVWSSAVGPKQTVMSEHSDTVGIWGLSRRFPAMRYEK